MSIVYTAPTWSYITPEDGNLGAVIAEFISLIPDSSSLRLLIYGWTDPQTYKAVIEAQKRGVDSQGGVDKSQSITPVESRNLGAFFGQIKRWDNDGNTLWWIGTSYEHDQIIHAKTVWANWTESSVLPYKDSLPSFADWRDYIKSGYPTVLRGSYNWSTSASKQVNTMDITPSPELCDLYQRTYNRVKAHNLVSNKELNMPVIHPTVISPEYRRFISDE